MRTCVVLDVDFVVQYTFESASYVTIAINVRICVYKVIAYANVDPTTQYPLQENSWRSTLVVCLDSSLLLRNLTGGDCEISRILVTGYISYFNNGRNKRASIWK